MTALQWMGEGGMGELAGNGGIQPIHWGQIFFGRARGELAEMVVVVASTLTTCTKDAQPCEWNGWSSVDEEEKEERFSRLLLSRPSVCDL